MTAPRLLLCATVLVATGCESYRVEYRRRPAFHQKLSDNELPDRVTLEDGTVLVFQTPGRSGNPYGQLGPVAAASKRDDGDEPAIFRIREEQEDGTIVIRAIMPEHVVANTLACLRTQEYELLWEQLVSSETKRAYEREGKGVDDFAAFFAKHRLELAKMLNRMFLGFSTYETVVDDRADGTIVCRFWPEVAKLFKFKHVVLVREDYGMKLHVIR